MWLSVISLLTILEVSTLIGPGFASTFLKFGEKFANEEYNRLKSASVHRGVLLSLSSAEKHAICLDAFSAQLYANVVSFVESSEEAKKIMISDSIESIKNGLEPEYPIFWQRTVEKPWSEPEFILSFSCLGKNFRERLPTKDPFHWYHINYAFHPKWFYSAHQIVSSVKSFTLWNFIALSPDHVPQDRSNLEKHYVNIQVTLMALREESPRYADQIQQRVDLFTLTIPQRFILCASILSTPVYRRERWEFSFDWMDTTTDTLEYVRKDVSQAYTLHPRRKLTATCIPCTAFEDGTDPKSKTKMLYLTTLYDNEHSVVVLKEEEDGVFVDKRFKNNAILITLFQDIDYAKLFSNFLRPKLPKE